MSITAPIGFRAAGVAAGIKSSGAKDLALVVNDGAAPSAAAVFTSNRFDAAPVQWSRAAMARNQQLGTAPRAVLLNSGGANACTGAVGFADTETSAVKVSQLLDIPLEQVLVCSTGLIGKRLPMRELLAGIDAAHAALSAAGGVEAAEAIITTDTRAKYVVLPADSALPQISVAGMAKGSGMLAPGLATMLVVLTTDALLDGDTLQQSLEVAVEYSFNRIDSDGCMSTNDTVILLASGASGARPDVAAFTSRLTQACQMLARDLISDAEGASHDIKIDVVGSATEIGALTVARAVARSNLFKTAIFGNDPNWGRILSAVGTVDQQVAPFDAAQVNVSINGIQICRNGGMGEDRNKVDLSAREVCIVIDLNAGDQQASLWTNDLTHDYVHENSAYSS